jgi:hypothetical protein
MSSFCNNNKQKLSYLDIGNICATCFNRQLGPLQVQNWEDE